MSKKINPETYSPSRSKFVDGEWWYYGKDGYRERMTTYAKKNVTRMFVNGKYIPKSHPLHKPGRYKSLDDAWSHEKIESTSEGDVYAITNPAWDGWVKIGKAVSADDRLNNYQTSSPYRDYTVLARISVPNRHEKELVMHRIFEDNAEARKGEWFKISEETTVLLFLTENKENDKE
jgi:hypothetical protein